MDILLFTDTVEELVVSVAHDQVHTDQVVDGAEATGRDVALYNSISHWPCFARSFECRVCVVARRWNG